MIVYLGIILWCAGILAIGWGYDEYTKQQPNAGSIICYGIGIVLLGMGVVALS